MPYSLVGRVCVFLLLGMLSGCDLVKQAFLSPEERINRAFPFSDAARVAIESSLAIASEVQNKKVKVQVDARIKLRALDCAKGYQPSWHSSDDDIRHSVLNKSCFAEKDDEIVQWLSLIKVGLLLAQPPLVPIPDQPPQKISASGFIQEAYFAKKAGVVLLETPQTIELVDLRTSGNLSSEARNRSQVGALSPNGRLYLKASDNVLSVKRVDTGNVVADFGEVLPYQFFWLDDEVAAYGSRDSKVALIDFSSGKKMVIPSIKGHLYKAMRLSGDVPQYAFFSTDGISVVKLDRLTSSVELVSETPANGAVWASNNSGVTADGKYSFSANSELVLVDLQSMAVESVSFEPFRLQIGVATPDPDKILVMGYIHPPGRDDSSGVYLYSISRRTLSEVDQEHIFPPRYLFIPSLAKQGVISNDQIYVRQALSTIDEVEMSEFVAKALVIASQRQEYASLKKQADQFMHGGLSSGRPVSQSDLPVARSNALPPSSNGLLNHLAENVQIEGVGVYQGLNVNRSRGEHTPGAVEVIVRRSKKPIVLVLSSYEAVNWRLMLAPGAQLAAVMVSGYYQSKVTGAGAVRVIDTGKAYAYKSDSAQYHALNREVATTFGKGMDIFQGRYDGEHFSVGGM